MTEKDLYKSLSEKKEPVYFLYGEERYSIDKAIQIARESLDPNFRDLNFTVIDSEYEQDVDKIVSCCESIPFMDSKRVIVVKNSDLFQNTSKNYSKNEIEKIRNYLEFPCQTTTVIFLPSQVDKRNELYKFANKKYDFYQSDRLDRKKFSSWVMERFKSRKISIDNNSREYFVEKSGYLFRDSQITLLDVENEIEKICLNSYNSGTITIIDIDKASSKVNDNDIFKFIDYIFAGESKNVYFMMKNIIDSQKSPLLLFSLISRHISTLIKIHILRKNGIAQDSISKMLSMHPFVVKKCTSQLKNHSYSSLIDLYNLCSDMDYRIKKGQIRDDLGLEVMIGRICKKDNL